MQVWTVVFGKAVSIAIQMTPVGRRPPLLERQAGYRAKRPFVLP